MNRNYRGLLIRMLALSAMLLLLTFSAAAQSTVRGFTLSFDSVQYDWVNNTSTWNYTLIWDGSDHRLSHLSIGTCANTTFLGASPEPFENMTLPRGREGEIGDPTTGVVGIKWDRTVLANDPTSFSFTIVGTPAVGEVSWSPKASTDVSTGTIEGPSCTQAQPNLEISKSCVPAAFVGDNLPWVITVTNSGNVALDVTLDDPLVNLHTVFSLAAGTAREFNVSYRATAAGTVTNTATASGSYYANAIGAAESASCSTDVYALSVSKSANTSYTRSFDWTLDKAVDSSQPEILIGSGETKSVAFVVTAGNVATDSNWNASGTIVVNNPAPIPAQVFVTDDLAGSSVPVTCPTAMPATVPAGGSLVCTYSVALPSGVDRVNQATATLTNGTSFHGYADVKFGDPSVLVDSTLAVTDTPVCPEGFTCVADLPSFTFNGPGSVNVNVLITENSAWCNTEFRMINNVTGIETNGTRRDAAEFVFFTAPCNVGCTLTIGYWKNHAGFTGRNEDEVTQYLWQYLGSMGGAKTKVVKTASDAVAALSMDWGAPSNGITKLYAQMLAAKLNIANGASSGDVDATIAAADAFLANNNEDNWSSLAKATKNTVIGWMSTFDNYNNGLIGPGHCD